MIFAILFFWGLKENEASLWTFRNILIFEMKISKFNNYSSKTWPNLLFTYRYLWLDWRHQLLESLNNTIIGISDDDRTLLIHVAHLPPTHFAAFFPVNSELPAIFICRQLYICSTLWKCWFFMSRTYMIGILWDQIMPSKLWHKKMDEFNNLSNGDLGWSVCSASAWWRSLSHAVVTWVL